MSRSLLMLVKVCKASAKASGWFTDLRGPRLGILSQTLADACALTRGERTDTPC